MASSRVFLLRVATATIAAANIVGGASAAPAVKLCGQLRAIVADAPNSFAAFKGTQTSQEKSKVEPYDLIDHYAATGWPDGAASCEITMNDVATSYGQRYPNYSCEFPITGDNKGATTKKLAMRAAACLPGTSHPIGPGLDKDGGMLLAHSKDYTVGYSFISGPATNTVSMLIQSDKK
jgi:hypothetical protein